MRSISVVSAAIVIAGMFVAYWILGNGVIDPVQGVAPASTSVDPKSTAVAPGTSPLEARTEVPMPPLPDARGDEDEATTPMPTMRVRLLGLVAEVPWTTAVSLDIEGEDETGLAVHHRADQRPDAEGRVSFPLPKWAAARMTKGWLSAWDSDYLRVSVRWNGGQDLDEEILLRVYAQATVTGRVVDDQGRPLRAAVTADAPGYHSKQTRADGTWSLIGTASTGLRIEARAIQESNATPMMPASVVVHARGGATTEVPDIVLVRTFATVTGRVLWMDGEPVAGANVGIRKEADSSPGLGSNGLTDMFGRVVLPVAPGLPVTVELWSASGLVPQPELRTALPGQEVEFRMPRPVTVRACRDGKYDFGGYVGFDDESLLEFTSHATRHEKAVVPTRATRARATSNRWRSPWRTIGPADAGKAIDLDMTIELGEVEIHFDCEHPVLKALSRWRRPDGTEEVESLRRSTADRPFRERMDPGHYHVTVEADERDSDTKNRDDAFLLPVARDVTVGGELTTLRFPVTLGGRLELTATDAEGTPIAARCTISGSSALAAQSIELDPARAATWLGVLPAGTYNLLCEFPGRGTRQRTVTIVNRKTARICLRP